MAKFDLAYKYTANIEGGFTVDNGGATYNGIAFKFWANDSLVQQIEKIVMAAKPKKKQLINNKHLEGLIISFYKKWYWDRISGDNINDQTLANFIYDFSVNSGSGIIIINKTISGKTGSTLTPATLLLLNASPAASYIKIKAARKNLYDQLAAKSKTFKNNYKGWIARLNSFPSSLIS